MRCVYSFTSVVGGDNYHDRQYSRQSSIWSRTESGWVMRFHQGTPYQP